MQRHRFPVTYAVIACVAGLSSVGVLAGCGGDDEDEPLPAGAIARVGDVEIGKDRFDRSLRFQQLRFAQQLTSGKLLAAANPKLPSFAPPATECVEAVLAAIPEADRAEAPRDQLRAACEAVPGRTKLEAIQQVLAAEVIEQEAKDEEVEVSDEDVAKGLDAAYQQEIGGKANLAKVTAATGLNEQDFREFVRQSLVFAKVAEKIVADAGKVTDEDVRSDYDENKKRYAQQESRELHVVVAKDEAGAQAARTELENGATFASVAQKYSTDEETRKVDGKLTQVTKGQLEKVAEDAAFSVGQTQLAGPVEGERGWYVIRVDKITPGRERPFDEIKDALKQQLEQTRPQEAVAKWQDEVLKRWKDRTFCAEGYNLVPLCKNQRPDTTTTTAPAPATGE